MTKNVIKAYKIRNIETGLFSTGGIFPKWKKTGKTWSSLGSVKSHLTLYTSQGCYGKKVQVPESWEIIELSYCLSGSQTFSAKVESERPTKK